MHKNKNHKTDNRQRFNDILRQTKDMHRPARPASPFGDMGMLIAVMRRMESVTDADATVTISRNEYNNLLAAKVTLGLMMKIATNAKGTAFVSVYEILQLIAGDSPTDATADT